MATMAKDGLALMVFGGMRLAHGLGDGFFFLFLGLGACGVAVWGLSRAMDIGAKSN
jgi:hypothetical protein